MKKKSLALLLAIAIVVVGVVAGTLAWLTAKSDTVTNTFTTSDIDIDLAETTGNDYKMIPGCDIKKDPTVTVNKDSEDCWLFVKLEKSDNYGTYLADYTIANGWEQLAGEDGVYCRKAKAGDVFHVLKDDKVTVLGTVTKADMTAAETNKPTLTVTAYASQLYRSSGVEFTAAEAWGNVQP